MHDVSFYFDFLSPYSGLALLQAERFAEEHDYQKDPSVEQASIVRLCVELARACWCEGRPLTELTVLQEVIEAVGLDATDLPSRILARPLKKKLKEYTAEALERGVFGVPTFVIGADEPGRRPPVGQPLLAGRGRLRDPRAPRGLRPPAAAKRLTPWTYKRMTRTP